MPGEEIEELSVKRKKKKKIEKKPRKKKISRLTTVSNRADLGEKKKNTEREILKYPLKWTTVRSLVIEAKAFLAV